MTLLFTSLFSAGAMPAPPQPPEPDFVWTTNLLYRFSASEGVHKDDAATPAAHGDGVARWVNASPPPPGGRSTIQGASRVAPISPATERSSGISRTWRSPSPRA